MSTAYIGVRSISGGEWNYDDPSNPYIWFTWSEEWGVGDDVTLTIFPIPHGITSITSATLRFDSYAIDAGAGLTLGAQTFYPSLGPGWDTSGSFSIVVGDIGSWHDEQPVYSERGSGVTTGERNTSTHLLGNVVGRVAILVSSLKIELEYGGTAEAPVLLDAYVDSPTGYFPHTVYVDMRPYASGGPSDSGWSGLSKNAWNIQIYEVSGNNTWFQTGIEGLISITFNAPGTYTLKCSADNWVSEANTSWVAGWEYSIGDRVYGASPDYRVCEVTVAGTSGGTEPVWPTVYGETVVDGGVTWSFLLQNFVEKTVSVLKHVTPYFDVWPNSDSSVDPVWGKSGYINSGALNYYDHIIGKGQWGDRSMIDVSPTPFGDTLKTIAECEGKVVIGGTSGKLLYSYPPYDTFSNCSNTGSYQEPYDFNGIDYDQSYTVGFAVGQENLAVSGFPTIAKTNGTSFTRSTLGESDEYESDGKVLFFTNEDSGIGDKVITENPSTSVETTVETTGHTSFTIGRWICPSDTFSQHGNGDQVLLGDTCRVSFGLWISTTTGTGIDPKVYFSLYYTDDSGGAATLIDQGQSSTGITSETLQKFEFDVAINTGHTFVSDQRLEIVLDIITTAGDTRTITYAMQGTEHASYFSVPTNMLGGLNAVKCISSTDAWACGWADWPDYKGYILHWDSISWKPIGVPLDIDKVKFVNVSFVDANHGWFLGTLYDEDTFTTPVRPVVLKYDTGAWEEETLPTIVPTGEYTAHKIRMTTTTDGWMIAFAGTPDSTHLIFHYSGNQWNLVETGAGEPLPTSDALDYSQAIDFLNREIGALVLKKAVDSYIRIYDVKSTRFMEVYSSGLPDAVEDLKIIDCDNIIGVGQDAICRMEIDEEDDDTGRVYVEMPM